MKPSLNKSLLISAVSLAIKATKEHPMSDEQLKADVSLVLKSLKGELKSAGAMVDALFAFDRLRARLEALEAMEERLKDREKVAKIIAIGLLGFDDEAFEWLPEADAIIAAIRGEKT